MAGPDTGVSGSLTDGSGIGTFTVPKIIKDAIVDALLSFPGALLAVNITGLEAALTAPLIVAVAVGDVLIRVAYRTILKWAQT
jgi:hypothetical protein